MEAGAGGGNLASCGASTLRVLMANGPGKQRDAFKCAGRRRRHQDTPGAVSHSGKLVKGTKAAAMRTYLLYTTRVPPVRSIVSRAPIRSRRRKLVPSGRRLASISDIEVNFFKRPDNKGTGQKLRHDEKREGAIGRRGRLVIPRGLALITRAPASATFIKERRRGNA